MKKLFVSLCLVATLFVILLTPDRPVIAFHSTGNKYQDAQEQVGLVSYKNADGAIASGSGVVIRRISITDGKPRLFVWTAKHVVSDIDEVSFKRVLHYNGTKKGEMVFTAKVLFRLPNTDAALLWLDAPPEAFAAASFANAEPLAPGSSVFHVGNFLRQFDGSVSRGIVSQTGIKPESPFWPWNLTDQTDLRILPGSSGGPIFSEASGKVIGLIVGGPNQGTLGVGCYVPVRVLIADCGVSSWAIYGRFCPSDEALSIAATKALLPKEAAPEKKPEGATPEKQTSPVEKKKVNHWRLPFFRPLPTREP